MWWRNPENVTLYQFMGKVSSSLGAIGHGRLTDMYFLS